MNCNECKYEKQGCCDSRFLQADSYVEERFFELCMQKNVRSKLLFDWVDSKGSYVAYTDFSRSDEGNFSRHDYSHSIAILNAIVSVLGKEKIDCLNATDLWMLLHCAYGHDVGMPYTFTQMKELWETINANKEFRMFFREALASEDDDLKKAAQYIDAMAHMLDKELLEGRRNRTDADIVESGTGWPAQIYRSVSYLTSEYVRRNHAKHSREMIAGCELFASKNRSKIDSRLYNYIGQCCYMHALDCKDVLDLPKTENDIETGHCHPRFIAYMLRLGDLLDISNNRFDEMDIMHYGGLPGKSELHKKKHEAIEHINFTDRKIEITARSDNEEVCQITNDWFTWIKSEVQFMVSHWTEFAPEEIGGCTLSEPVTQVYLNDEIFYRVEDCEFHVDKDTLIDLVIGRNLYKTKFDFMKEYIQNALDATKMRFWIDILSGSQDYFIEDETKLKEKNRGKLLPFDFKNGVFKQYALEVICDYGEQDNGQDTEKKQGIVYIEIIDKGIGIDKECVDAISNIGSGWRRRKRYAEYLDEMPRWLKPTGGFGIGMQSGFMITNEIQIESRCEGDAKGRKIGLYSGKKNGRIEERDYPIKSNGTKIAVGIPYDWFMDVENYKEYSDLRFMMDDIDFMDPGKTMDRVADFIVRYLRTIMGDPLFPILVKQRGRKPEPIDGFYSRVTTEGETFEWEERKYMVFRHEKEWSILLWDIGMEILCRIELSDKSEEETTQEWFYKGVRVWTDNQEKHNGLELYRYIGNFKIDIMGHSVKECLTIDRNCFKSGFEYNEISNRFAKACLGYLIQKRLILSKPLNGRKFMRCMAAYRYMPDEIRQLMQESLDEITPIDCETLFTRDDMLIYRYQCDKEGNELINPEVCTLYHMCRQLYMQDCIYWGRWETECVLSKETKEQIGDNYVWQIIDEKNNGIILLLEEMLFKLYHVGDKKGDKKTDKYYLACYNGKEKEDSAHTRQEEVFLIQMGQRQIFVTNENYYTKLHVTKIPFYTEEQQDRLKKKGKNLIISPIPAIYSDKDSLFTLRNIDDPEEVYFKRITGNKMYPSLIDWVFNHQEQPGLYSKKEIKEEYNKLIRYIFSTYIRRMIEEDVGGAL